MPKINVDFSGVEDGFKLPEEGRQICKVKSIEIKDGPKGKYLKWTLVIGTGPDKGAQIFHITSFAPVALFNLRNTLIACGQQVPKSSFQVNTDLCINKIVGVDVVHSEYMKDGEKKKSAKVGEIYPVAKTENGWVRTDKQESAKASEAVMDMPSGSTPDTLEEDADEIDI